MLPIALAALISASLFAGAAGYISLVEHPARLRLDDAAALAQWIPSYAKALPLQSGLAVLGGALGLAAWYVTGDWLWIGGSLTLLANWPFTLFAIMPTNKRLKTIAPGPESRRLLVAWGRLHDVRSVLGVVSMGIFAAALVR